MQIVHIGAYILNVQFELCIFNEWRVACVCVCCASRTRHKNAAAAQQNSAQQSVWETFVKLVQIVIGLQLGAHLFAGCERVLHVVGMRGWKS